MQIFAKSPQSTRFKCKFKDDEIKKVGLVQKNFGERRTLRIMSFRKLEFQSEDLFED